jgi:cell division GTPase FtsZ
MTKVFTSKRKSLKFQFKFQNEDIVDATYLKPSTSELEKMQESQDSDIEKIKRVLNTNIVTPDEKTKKRIINEVYEYSDIGEFFLELNQALSDETKKK